MPDLVRSVEVAGLLEELSALEAELLPAERELMRDLAAKYAEPCSGDFDDVMCLQVIQRNVKIRRGYAPEAGPDSQRAIQRKR